MTTPKQRLEELLEFVLDGSCNDDQRKEFAQLLDDNPELISPLTREVFVHSLLQWQSESITIDLPVLDSCFQDVEGFQDLQAEQEAFIAAGETKPKSSSAMPHATSPPAAWKMLWAAAAALLFVSLFWMTSFFESAKHKTVVARLVNAENVIWTKQSQVLMKGGRVVPGRLQTEGGEFTLEFTSGPVVRVSGPVSMMIESDMLVHLDRGQATARVPDSLKGFAINTPVINVIDQGTEFGVATRGNGFTDVVVFDGKVDLQDSISADTTPTRLLQGEAARVDRLGTLQRIMQIGRNAGGSWWTSDYPESQNHVIKEVRDNIPPSDGSQYFCYQITFQGLYDDVFAYADHPHQWNGLTRSGLPKFLEGADYVKTFNDYRYLNDFQMEVILSQPANLYVFFDNRVPPPDWLTEQFEDTGVDIGLDEGPWEGIPDHVNAQGAGQSIDNVFSVWRRECRDLTPISLGLMGETAQARAMYGIAATPLEPVLVEPAPLDSAWKHLLSTDALAYDIATGRETGVSSN